MFDLELHFCALIVAHLCIHVENIQMIHKKLLWGTTSNVEIGQEDDNIAPPFKEEVH